MRCQGELQVQFKGDVLIVHTHSFSSYIHEGHEITPSEELKRDKEVPHLYTFMAIATVGNVSRLLLTNHTG